MKVEHKWYITVEIEVDAEYGDDEAVEAACTKATNAYEEAKQAFFDSLDDNEENEEIVGYDILNEEDK